MSKFLTYLIVAIGLLAVGCDMIEEHEMRGPEISFGVSTIDVSTRTGLTSEDVEDMQIYILADPRPPFFEWLPEISVLCIMAALLCVSVAMKKKEEHP